MLVCVLRGGSRMHQRYVTERGRVCLSVTERYREGGRGEKSAKSALRNS